MHSKNYRGRKPYPELFQLALYVNPAIANLRLLESRRTAGPVNGKQGLPYAHRIKMVSCPTDKTTQDKR